MISLDSIVGSLLGFSAAASSMLGSLPSFPVAALAAATFVVSLFTRTWSVILAVLLLDLLMVLGAAMQAAPEYKMTLLLLALALSAFIIGQGFSNGRRSTGTSEIKEHLGRLDARLSDFCDALDRRSQSLDKEAVEIARRRAEAEVA
jgi:hypothetical protein